MWVAPNPRAHSSLRSSTSIAMTVRAPAIEAPRIAASPTPPQPITATVSPRRTAAGVERGAEPGHHAAAEQAGDLGLDARSSTFVHWPAATSVFAAKAPIPRAGESGVPSVSVIVCAALWVAKQYHGSPR